MKLRQFFISFVLLTPCYAAALNWLPERGSFQVPVRSYKEIQFGDVIRQQYDFSCGSAALASLLTYHYRTPKDEADIFKAMFANGNRELIEKQGFSLLDMKRYLMSQGFESEGYKLTLEKIESIGLPVITLVDFDGYRHFVVVKGINQSDVILGDPSRGTIVMSKTKFVQFYQGIVLLVRNHAEVGKETFIDVAQYRLYNRAPLDSSLPRDSIGQFTITLPESGEY
ncbi:C39 family peptidase [Vibrio sp. TRT 21S02]|uniref:C39 family peptidase n=1 Tax=Vibrio sp. TRT 21S02 TaxID=3418507 RepID=UPI003CF4F999